ncbi:MAG: DNA-processing protein DprA [Flavobacteriaceae bacterium]
MHTKEELLYILALQRVPNLGDTSAKKLLQAVGSAEGIFREKKARLLKIEGIGAFRLKDLSFDQLRPEAEEELQFMKDQRIDYRYFLDENYPEYLKHCLDSPILFFQKGNIHLQDQKIISIVGTRNATPYGIQFCESLLEELAPLNPVIVSGLAYGIDITAQRKAMELGLQTIGCLAHGLNQIYPKTHKKYVSTMERNGGVITEFWSNDLFDRTNFLKRNRIIAGLSEATIVIESAEKGGSLVTAEIANSYDRAVFAVPGKVTDPQSQGCNDLIRFQKAQCITSAADVIYHLGWELQEPKPKQTRLFVEMTEEEKKIWQYLKGKDKEMLDVIALDCQLPTFKLASLLLTMELKGLVRPLPGKMFQYI